MTKIYLNSLEDLFANETDIAARITNTLNGGHLFLVHPFQCLMDLGVELAPDVQSQLISQNPSLGALSIAAYNSIKAQASALPTKIQVRGLFRRA